MKELPPKVISDIPCTLSTEQKALYTRFVTSSDAKRSLSCFQDHINLLRQGIEDSKGKKVGKDVFRALLYLRLLCTHPTLVLERERGGEDNAIVGAIDPADEALSRLDCSGKLLALNDLLRSSRICSDSLVGADNDQSTLYTTRSTFNLDSGSAEEEFDSLLLDSNADFDASESIDVSQGQKSKCLIFAQFTRSLDAIEDYLFTPHMPSLRYLRIDGNVSPEDRSKRVDEFNTDDSIKVMLLTTRVGGLGLNLTGADTVIILEPDWNPYVDLQAMDRAHRIGQTKMVNVYRLISSNTIEEKIMKLQSIKKEMSEAIVNSDNSTMYSMGTDRLLDLFDIESNEVLPSSEAVRDGAVEFSRDGPNQGLNHIPLEDEYATLSTASFLSELLAADP